MAADFSELLDEAEKLTADIEGISELPKIDRSLRQVLQDSHELFTKVARTGSQDVQANLLLGSQGIDLPRIVQKLDNISTKLTFEPLKPTVDTDVQAHLQNEIQNIIVGVIETDFKRCSDTAKQDAWEHEKSEWVQERLKILNSMVAPSRDLSIVERLPSVFMDFPIRTSSILGSEEAIYATEMAEYNKCLQRGHRSNLINAFAKAAREFQNTKINDMWEILKYVTDLPPFPSHENVIKARYGCAVVRALVSQAKKYLEDRYKTYMTNVINENLAEAMRGGVPGTYSLARSYVGIRLHGEYSGLTGGMIEDKPLWPIVYYCLRSGDLTAALHCLKQSKSDLQSVIKLLETKFKNPENSEISKMEAALQFEYRTVVHNSTDPFQRIVYDVLCCSDVSDEHSEIAKTADDYLWLKLSFLRFDVGRDDTIAYRNLQSMVSEEYGESHYNAEKQPHLYFQMLALTGQFEAAFEFLARLEKYQIHSVQMAVALNELHLLAIPLTSNAPLISVDELDPKPARRLNIARLIMIYVQRFEVQAPQEAIQYFYTLRNIVDEHKQKVFVRCIVDLAVESRSYEMLLGKVLPNGDRTPGFINQFVSEDIKVEDIAQSIGKALIDMGALEDAIDLFDFANNQEEALSLLRTLLSQVVHLKAVEGSLRQRLAIKANDIASRYSRDGYECSASSMSSFIILKDLITFFDHYHSKKFIPALKTLNDRQLIPLDQKDVEERVTMFKRLTTDVSKVMPDVLLATMNIVFDQYQKIKSNEYVPNRYQDASRETQLTDLRQQAKTLTNFTGMLPYHMPGDFNSKLLQMEILMH